MDIDSALNELGMLSAITDSRKDYQGEQEKKNGSSCFHVVTANPQFVVNIGAVQHRNSSSEKSLQEVGDSGDQTEKVKKTSGSHLERSAKEHRSLKVSGRLHHRYFFRPYSKTRAQQRQLGIVKGIQNRSREGHFHIRLPPPAESTLTQAMASMNIEREATSRPRNSQRMPPVDIRNRTGLRAHAR